MFSFRKKYYHGEIKILDNQGEEIASGTGIFVTEERKFISRINTEESTTLKFKTGWRIALIEYGTKNVIISTESFLRKEMIPMLSYEQSLNVIASSAIILKNLDVTKRLIKNGINNLSIILSGQGDRTITFTPPTDTNRFGSQQITTKIQPKELPGYSNDSFEIKLFAGFRSEKNQEIQNTLRITISMSEAVPLKDLFFLYNGLELYWILDKKDTFFLPLRVSIDGEEWTSEVKYELPAFPNQPNGNILYVSNPKIDSDLLSKVLRTCLPKSDKERKFATGLRRFLETAKKKKDSCESFIFGYGSSLDIITSYIANKKRESQTKEGKEKIKADILRIQDAIRTIPDLSTRVKDFYCNKDASYIYESITRYPISENLEKTKESLGLKFSDNENTAVNKLIKIRHAMMHGDGYNLEKELEGLHGGMFVNREISENGSEVCSIGYNEGYISLTRKVIEKILKAYFASAD